MLRSTTLANLPLLLAEPLKENTITDNMRIVPYMRTLVAQFMYELAIDGAPAVDFDALYRKIVRAGGTDGARNVFPVDAADYYCTRTRRLFSVNATERPALVSSGHPLDAFSVVVTPARFSVALADEKYTAAEKKALVLRLHEHLCETLHQAPGAQIDANHARRAASSAGRWYSICNLQSEICNLPQEGVRCSGNR